MGVLESLIKMHGAWCSDAYKRYLSYPIKVHALVALKMSNRISKAGF